MEIKSAESCHFDILSLGEIMLRLDPREGRVRTARSFEAWEGGGEYNVARGLRRCFGQRAGLVSAFANNEVGRLLENLILTGGVDMQFVKWMDFDGVGRACRNGLNFTERGYGVRAALGTSDRGHTAASQLKAGDIDWDHIFGDLGVRWFHTGGIYAALSDTTPGVIAEALQAAKKHGTITSYDLNFRSSLWSSFGGKENCQKVNRSLAPYVDSFASGLIYGFLTKGDGQTAVDYGAAHGALAMTTAGDTTMASVDEVEALIAGDSARVKR